MESLLLGLTSMFLLNPESKFSFTIKALVGIAHVHLPELNGTSKTDTSFVIVKQNSAPAFGVSYLADIRGNYDFSKNWCILLNISYFGISKITFKSITEMLAATNGGLIVPGIYSLSNSKLPQQILSNTSDYKQPIGVISLSFGIGLNL